MECPRCHTVLPSNTRFCPVCGLAVENLVSQEVEEPVDERESEKRTESDEPEVEAILKEVIGAEREGQEPSQEPDQVSEDDGPDDAVAQPDSQREKASAADDSQDTIDEAPEYGGEQDRTEVSAPLDPSVGDAEHKVRVRRRIIVVIVALVVCAIVGGTWYTISEQEAQRQREEEARREAIELSLRTPHELEVGLGLPESDAVQSMPVPIRIEGKTQKKKTVNEVQVVTGNDSVIELLPGTYHVSLEGNAIASDGSFFVGSVDSFEVKVKRQKANKKKTDIVVTAEDADGEDASSHKAAVFAFTQTAPESITDEDLAAVGAWMSEAGIDSQQYVEAATARRSEELARIEAENAAREEAQRLEAERMMRELEAQMSEVEEEYVPQESVEPEAYYEESYGDEGYYGEGQE